MKDSQLSSLLTPILAHYALELEDIDVMPAGKRRLLRVVVDGEGPQGLGPLLDDSQRQYEPGKFQYLAGAERGTRLCMTFAHSKVRSFDDALRQVLRHFDDILGVMLPTLREERRLTYSPVLPVSPSTGRVLQVPVRVVDAEAGTIAFTDARPKDYWAELGYDWHAGH